MAMTSNQVKYVDEGYVCQWFIDEDFPVFRSQSGYGTKIPTQWRAKCSDGRTRRLYAISVGNSCSFYLRVGRKDHFVHDWDIPATVEKVGAE